MFETIGIIAVWLCGAALSYGIPLLSGMLYSDTKNGNLGHAFIGYHAGRVLCALYMALTFLYFVIT